jgi:outer membrane protein assembly factor BamB
MIQPAQRKPASAIRWLLIVAGAMVHGSLVVSTYSNHLFFKGIPIRALAPDGTPAIPVKWEFTGAGAVSAALALGDDGTLYAASEDGFLYAISSSGNLQWKFDAGAITAAPTIGADGTIYITNEDQRILRVNPAGTQQWENGGGPYADKQT